MEDESHRLAIIGAPQRAQRIDHPALDASPLNSHVHLWGGLFTALSNHYPNLKTTPLCFPISEPFSVLHDTATRRVVQHDFNPI